MGVGYWRFTQLKIEAYPDIADTNVIVVAQNPGRAAEEVEQQVTVPIERALSKHAECARQTQPDYLWAVCCAADVQRRHRRLFRPSTSYRTAGFG